MNTVLYISIAILSGISCVLLIAWLKSRAALSSLREKYAPIAAIDGELSRLRQEQDDLRSRIKERRQGWEAEIERTLPEIESLSKQVDLLRDAAEIQSFGFYEPHFDFGTSEEYKNAVKINRDKQKSTMKRKDEAAFCAIDWTVEGSKAKGRQMINKQLKLMLRAFNGECDAAITKARFDNVTRLEERIERSFAAINKLGETNQCRITRAFKELKLEELRLAYEYAVKKQDEREEQRRIRVEMQEEERARKEIENAQREAEKEENRFEQALIKARAELEQARDSQNEALRKKISLLEEQFREAHDRKEKAISRAQLTRSGHVYVISNIGSFGEDVFKIGMTRRLEPLDRVKELGDASVPFPFDVHAMIYSEDAHSLESKLHERFPEKQVNLINQRKEFFGVTLAEVRDAVTEFSPDVEFITTAVAEQFRASAAIRKKKELEAEQRREKEQATEIAAARDKFDHLRESWKAEPVA
ncbi:MAG: DUF4041 domain-containing protein [bacterium]|nr:DUF4041 domain-containing protein [bacterium]